MPDDHIRITPPLYIAHTITRCWRCGEHMPVVALIAPHVIAPNFQESEGQVCTLSFIEELPETVLEFVQNRFPSFQFRHSKEGDSRYYANTCPKCSVIYGDWYLHDEPDGPFFSTTVEAAKGFKVETVPLGESITMRADLGIGGDLILKHAIRLDIDHREQ